MNLPLACLTAALIAPACASAAEAPTGVTTKGSDGAVLVSWKWTDMTDRYLVYVAGEDSVFHAATKAPVDDTRYLALGLENGATYKFQVTAVSRSGVESKPSNAVSGIPDASIPTKTGSRSEGYGSQIVVADLAAVGLTLVGAEGASLHPHNGGFLIVLGAGSIFFSGPAVHWMHGNGAKGFISLGLRVGCLALGAGSIAAAYETGAVPLVVGGVLLALAGPVLDAAYLARGPAPKTENHASVEVVPIVAASRGSARLGLVARF